MKTTSLTLAITAAVVAAYSVTMPAAISDPVTTATGKLSGVTLPSGVRAFKGIPFGAPPVGELRWKEPQPVAKWEGVRKADQFGNVCVQPSQPNRVPNNVTVDLPDSPKIERGLPLSERVDVGDNRAERSPAGHGVDLRRRLQRRRRIEQAQRRRGAREEGRRPGDVQLSPRAVRLLLASRADEGVGPQRVGQSGAGRQHRRAAMGEGEHRGVRRRPEQRDDLRRVGRRGDGRRARRLTGRQGPVPSRDQRERRVDGAGHGSDGATRAGGARAAAAGAGRGGRGRGERCRPATPPPPPRHFRRSPSCVRVRPKKSSRRCVVRA